MARKVCLKVEVELILTIEEDMEIDCALGFLILDSHWKSEIDVIDYKFGNFEIEDSKLM